ncbi:hypothetical protein HED60_20745 [Planctomycetales bacterium ZRK34]|nr:hypothetical protein HED60_20745 [Planctomycetales bacterium ZRK34]
MRSVQQTSKGSPARVIRLTDVLATIVVLAVVCTLVGPQFSTASQNPGDAAVAQDLTFLRQQIALYRLQHRDLLPGHIRGANRTADADLVVKQMTQFTDEKGNVSAVRSDRFRYGPYLTGFPMHAQTGISVLRLVGSEAAAGWVYDAKSGELTAGP